MAVYKLFPTKDATMYSLFPTLNTGRDEILEASTKVNGTYDVNVQASRMLLSFSTTEINDVITNKIANKTWDAHLKIFVADVQAINSDTTLETYPVSSSWNMGTGKYLDYPEVNDGVSWYFRVSSGSTVWRNSNFGPYVTASYDPSLPGGGTWYTGSSIAGLNVRATQSFSFYDDKDLDFTVTDIVKGWVSGAFENNGFIIKQINSQEFIYDLNEQNILKYFSRDTNTIYPPQLEFRWRDYSFNTGSSIQTIVSSSEVVLSFPNNAGIFNPDSIQRFRVNSRPKYPPRVFQTSSLYTQNYYLPTGSYYAIKDLDTNEYVIDFDTNFTQISADSESNYFDVYMNGLEPERYYKILVKTTINNSTIIFDNDFYFKIVNG
jgi:hypothetical protein